MENITFQGPFETRSGSSAITDHVKKKLVTTGTILTFWRPSRLTTTVRLIKETLLIQKLQPTLNASVSIEKLLRQGYKMHVFNVFITAVCLIFFNSYT